MTLQRFNRLLVVTGVVAVVGLLSLSDSVTGPLKDGLDLVAAAWRGVESRLGLDLHPRSHLPFDFDTMGHFAAWAVVGAAAARVATTAGQRIGLGVGLFALSAFVEAGQRYLSWSRSAELTDLAANGVGLLAGMLAASAAEAIIASRPSRLRP